MQNRLEQENFIDTETETETETDEIQIRLILARRQIFLPAYKKHMLNHQKSMNMIH